MFEWIWKKKEPLLTEEDNRVLREIQRQNYLKEAKLIMETLGKEKARTDLLPKPKPIKDNF